MSNEEFQKIVLEKLGSLEKGQQEIRVEQEEMKKEQQEMKKEQQEMKKEQQAMKKDQQSMQKQINSIVEQTADLSEFRYEINEKIDGLRDDINAMEIITSRNWNDIARIKAAR